MIQKIGTAALCQYRMDYDYDLASSNRKSFCSNDYRYIMQGRIKGVNLVGLTNQVVDNYSYDAIGNLTADQTENIDEIRWTLRGKLKRVIFSDVLAMLAVRTTMPMARPIFIEQ